MLGFEPVAEASLEDAQLAPANQALAEYARWYRHIDAWVVLRAEDPTFVLTWRVEAEERMKASGKPGLSRADIDALPRISGIRGDPANRLESKLTTSAICR